MWGHSGGGFITADALLRAPYNDFFKVGIAESGNHDQRQYEDDWGERYQGPLVKNPDGTDNYAIEATQTQAAGLKGHLLLIHGTMDNNVPPYNTLLVADALIKANKEFDMKTDGRAEKDPPEHVRDAAVGEQPETDDDVRGPVPPRQRQVDAIAGQVRHVAREHGGIVVQTRAAEDPAGVGPPRAFPRRVRIALAIRMLVVDAVSGHPEDRPSLQRERAAPGEGILEPLVGLVAPVRQQTVIAHPDAQHASRRAGRARIGQPLGDPEPSSFSFDHQLHALGPPRDHLVQRKRDRLVPRDRTVEHPAVRRPAGVMHAHL